MSSEDQISSLVLRVQEARAGRQAVALEDVCREAPELVAEVKRRLDQLDRFDRVCEAETHAPVPQEWTEPGATLPRGCSPPHAEERRLGHYLLLRLLGSGGMGEVYEAEDDRLQRRVALKCMRPEYACRPEHRQRFLREARLVASLEHDHIVPIFEVGEEEQTLFLAMPLLHGQSLDDRLKCGPNLPLPEVLRIGRETAEALAFAHEHGLVHRDIKPGNIWLEAPRSPFSPLGRGVGSLPPLSPRGRGVGGEGSRVKVLDFGLARPVVGGEGMTQVGAFLGTPGYAAPEQVDGQPVDGRADLFSLGVVLYRLATGRLAFQGQSAMQLLRAVMTDNPPAPRDLDPGLPLALSDLIVRLLAKDPGQRPASAREVSAALQAIAHEGTLSLPPTPGRPPAAQASGIAVSGPLPVAPRNDPQLPLHATPVPPRGRHVVPLVAGALLGVALLAGSWFTWHSLSKPVDHAGSRGTVVPPVIAVEQPLRGELIVSMWTTKDKSKRGRRIGVDPLAVPVREDEQLHLEAKLNQPAYVYLLWVDGKGGVTPLYPWNDNRIVQETLAVPPPAQDPRDDVHNPESEMKGWAVDDTVGLDTMLLLARKTPLPANVRLVELVGKVPPAPLGPPGEVVLRGLDRGEPVVDDKIDPNQNRRPKAEARKIDDQLLQLMAGLKGHFELIRAVQFAHVGK